MANIEGWITALENADPRERLKAVRAILREAGKLPLDDRRRAAEALSKLADDPEPFVRWRVAAALGELGHPAGLDGLRELAGDAHANTRLRVALSAAMLDAEEALPLLEQLAGDTYKIENHAVVRAFAAIGLGRLGSAKAIDSLNRLAEDEDDVVRWHAVVAMGDVGDARAGPALVKRLGDPVPFVRGHAAIALAQIGYREALANLQEAARVEPHPKMKGVIESAVKLLSGEIGDPA